MRTWLSDEILIDESVQKKKWTKIKGQILPGEENGQKQKVKSCQVLFSFLGFKKSCCFLKTFAKRH